MRYLLREVNSMQKPHIWVRSSKNPAPKIYYYILTLSFKNEYMTILLQTNYYCIYKLSLNLQHWSKLWILFEIFMLLKKLNILYELLCSFVSHMIQNFPFFKGWMMKRILKLSVLHLIQSEIPHLICSHGQQRSVFVHNCDF